MDVEEDSMKFDELQAEYEQLQNEYAVLSARKKQLEAENQWLKEQFKLAKHRQFGASSEKIDALVQTELCFNEAEATSDAAPIEPAKISVRKPKSTGHREKMLEDLPVEVVEHKLTEDDQVCKVCGGHLHEMSTQVREEIEIIPAQVKLVRHVTSVYSCRSCEKNEIEVPIVNAPSPKAIIPKSLATPSSIAYVMAQKYVEAMPLYRQEKHFERLGIEIPRTMLSNWTLKGGEMLEPIYDRMHELLLERDIVHSDETPIQVLGDAKSKSYMWLYRSGRYGPPIVLYDYQPGRDGKYAAEFLGNFAGYLHADGWHAYEKVKAATLVGCWAHGRRKFHDAHLLLPKDRMDDPRLLPNIAIATIKKLYEIEERYRDASPEDRKAARNELSRQILDDFKEWIDRESGLVTSQSVLGQAFTYCKNQWPKLIRFLDDGRLEIDNNRAERSIKPFVIGRKNWLFANTPRGARTSAVIYSIVETAKENGLNPYAYLKFVFERIRTTGPVDATTVDSLLPWAEEVQSALRISKTDTGPS